MAKVAQRYLEVDPWRIVEKGFHPGRSKVSESIFSLGNEFMGIRGYFEEGYGGESLLGSYFNGIFEEEDIVHPQWFKGLARRTHYLVNAVDWLRVRIRAHGETLDLAASKFRDFSRSLDLRTGVLTREFVWLTPKGQSLRLRFERFTSMADPNLGCQRITFESEDFTGIVRIEAALDFGTIHMEKGCNMWPHVKSRQSGDILALMGRTERSGHRVASAMRLTGSESISEAKTDGQSINAEVSIRLRPGQTSVIDRVVVHATEKDPAVSDGQIWTRVLGLARAYRKITWEGHLAEHQRYWEHVWDSMNLEIDGDPENEQGLRFSIFQLHQTYHGVDPSLNVSAKGLTGEEYNGYTWWDTETYCLPFYMFNNPQAARNLLRYRYGTLPQAVERGKEKGCKGARYPMCTIDGTEACGTWQHGDLEIHVSVAVAFGIWHFVNVTGNRDFLYREGVEALLQICRYYASRGQWSPLTGEYGFWCVMGPDEFHMMVHNNCYTNRMAQKCFEYTLGVLEEMEREEPKLLNKARRRVKLENAEIDDWRNKAEKMRVPLEPETGVYSQHDGFFDLPHIGVESIPTTDFPLYKNWAYFEIFRWDMIKQPDVVLLQFLNSHDYTPESKRVNFDYYEPRCVHESSLSPAIHSIMAAELGRHEKAYDYWKHAARLDLDDYNRNTHAGLHTTSMAAAWLNLVYGFGGLRSDGPRLSFRPSIPAKWRSFRFRLMVRDSILEVGVNREKAEFTVVQGPGFEVDIFDKTTVLGAEPVQIALPGNRKG
ncbi:family 65 glycosyl hydrolase [bacterium]|nr:family 65 glycosyl hydrolase [bacterium]